MKPRVNPGSRDKAVRPDGALMSQQRFGNRSRSAGSRPPATTGPFGYISRRAASPLISRQKPGAWPMNVVSGHLARTRSSTSNSPPNQ